MDGAMLRVLGKATSINVRKVLWACEETDVAYAREDWGSGFRGTDVPEFLALNPNGLVPVLVDGAGVIWESNVIVRYLAARAGRHDLLPGPPLARAHVEMWMDWQAAELNPSWRYAFMALVRKSPEHADRAEIARSVTMWNRNMRILEAQLARTGAYVAGEVFTVADIAIGLSVNRWRMTPLEHPDLPAVAAYHQRLAARAAFLQHGANGTP